MLEMVKEQRFPTLHDMLFYFVTQANFMIEDNSMSNFYFYTVFIKHIFDYMSHSLSLHGLLIISLKSYFSYLLIYLE